MKRKDIIALHSKSIEELKTLVKSTDAEIIKLKKELIQKKLKNTSLIKIKSDDLARFKTELNQKNK